MAEAYDFGTRTLAEQLYVFRGRTYEQIAEELGVSEIQLKRWGKAGDWRAKREQYQRSKANNVARLIGIRDRILNDLEAEIQPNVVHQQLAAIRQADMMIEERLNPVAAEMDRPALFLEDLRFVAEVLQEEDPEGLKILSRNFDLIVQRFKERHAQKT